MTVALSFSGNSSLTGHRRRAVYGRSPAGPATPVSGIAARKARWAIPEADRQPEPVRIACKRDGQQLRRPPRRVSGRHGRASPGRPARHASWPDFTYPGSGADEAPIIHSCFLRPVLMILDRRPPPKVAADPRSSMGPQLVPGLGTYSGCCCHLTRSNSLPSGSANVVCDTLNVTPPVRTAGSLSSLSGLAPRPVSRSISSS